MLTGLRGVGKTVLLNEMANLAEDKDWIVARLEVRPDGSQAVLGQLTSLLAAGLRAKQGPKPTNMIKRAMRSLKEPEGGIADVGSIRHSGRNN